ncbi:unnamed protein product [Mytilus edulis]|uniref:Uncharacterized protein n=1 Tax=Mytilus edulis TaxID=6550 RepID=A0A8S3T442_MYTED|nr:unnamed protein product [Mytilus edulis]
MLNEEVIKESIADVTSTDGLDIVVRKCKINIHDGSWIIKENIYDDKMDRLQRAIIQSENVEKESSISTENMKKTNASTQFSENIRKQRTTSKLGDSVPIIDNTSAYETGEQNINHHANMSTSKNIENVIGGNMNDNKNSTIADKNSILKVNEDKDISAPL